MRLSEVAAAIVRFILLSVMALHPGAACRSMKIRSTVAAAMVMVSCMAPRPGQVWFGTRTTGSSWARPNGQGQWKNPLTNFSLATMNLTMGPLGSITPAPKMNTVRKATTATVTSTLSSLVSAVALGSRPRDFSRSGMATALTRPSSGLLLPGPRLFLMGRSWHPPPSLDLWLTTTSALGKMGRDTTPDALLTRRPLPFSWRPPAGTVVS